MLIITQVPKHQNVTASNGIDPSALPSEAKIILMDPKSPHKELLVLSKEFYSACSPDLSFDGRTIVFTGQKNEDDPWQIYEMNLSSQAYTSLTSGGESCYEPLYLPGDRILYAKDDVAMDMKSGNALFVLSSGRDLHEQITFSPGTYRGTSLLHDGRILSLNSQLNVDSSKTQLMVMRPDGTKEMLFYKSDYYSELFGKGKEANNGMIYLLEKNKEGTGKLFSLTYNNPLHSKKWIAENSSGDFIGLDQLNSGMLLACYRTSQNDAYNLYELDPKNTDHFKPLLPSTDFSTIEVVAVEKRKVPKKIPSEVNVKEQTALLLCQDVNFIGFHADTLTARSGKAVKLEVLGLENSLGIIDVEKDGSVYLKIAADTPFKLQTLDDEGEIVNGPSSWINLRPNERRACVGCHQGNEVVPLNRQPLSVLKEPVLIPQKTKLLAGRE